MPFPPVLGDACALSPSPRSCRLFAGTSLYRSTGIPIHVPDDVYVHGPVVRDDIATLVADCPAPGVIVVADGLFHQSLAVGHAEIRDALQSGWRVWGLSSMGALRAYEMRNMGMRGFGQVYAMFETEDDFQDDEVVLMHEDRAPFRPLTEPLVHYRAAVGAWQGAGLISEASRSEIVGQLKDRWYGNRTPALFESLLVKHAAPAVMPRLRTYLSEFDRYRIKTLDLAEFLASKVWRQS